jgi:hypothetical protein
MCREIPGRTVTWSNHVIWSRDLVTWSDQEKETAADPLNESRPRRLQVWESLPSSLQNGFLKVLTNEKRGGFTVVSFDRSRFKLFSRKFSHKLLQAPSCERHKTAPRTLFLSFANYNCFPITLYWRAATHCIHNTLNWNNGIVYPPRCLKRR